MMTDLKHVDQQSWQWAKDCEREDVVHPCDHWLANQCMCKGACSCHWVQGVELEPCSPDCCKPGNDWQPCDVCKSDPLFPRD